MAAFTPRYPPWRQRLCLVPDGDFFAALREGRARVVTDTIASFTPDGLHLDSGRDLPADIVVSATGLEMELMHGLTLRVDGAVVRANGDLFLYYASSDTRMHVATSKIDVLVDYVLNTPPDALRTAKCVEQRIELIRKNQANLNGATPKRANHRPTKARTSIKSNGHVPLALS